MNFRPSTSNAETNADVRPTYIADMAIASETGQAQPVNMQPLDEVLLRHKTREQMGEVLDIILDFCRKDTNEVEDLPFLKFLPNLQANHTGSQSNTRPVSENFKRKRA